MPKKSILVLLRHGQSQWNLENRFTGWTNVDLTQKGCQEAERAGRLISKCGFNIDIAFVSLLKRSIKTCKICLNQFSNQKVKVNQDWRLNERHYGDLQGLNKAETAQKFGEEQVLQWRRSFDVAPPKIDEQDPRHPSKDPLYDEIDKKLLPSSESLKDTMQRVSPFLDEHLFPQIKQGKDCLVVAHGNSLRAIFKIIKNISDENIIKLNIPTGEPYVFELDNKLKILGDYYLGEQKK